ncbi:MAG: sodium:solute symporter family protein [Saprospiraceae bacterium]|nr:sodium:solute symporter family protein [Saprospiraceae bacterium]
MQLATIDWLIVLAFFALSLAIGLLVARKSSKNSVEFFLSGRNMPWWLLGVSMVATTFSADTPNLVTDIIRKNGVAGNWVWWAFLLTGMLTVFVYAKLWRRSGILTDLEFYELRYSGKPAAFLRGFRAIYLGVIFNVMIMATVALAGIKIAGVLLGLSPVETVVYGGLITVLYTSLGGLRGVILTDFFQFILAMVGMVGAAVVVLRLPDIGGLSGLLTAPAVTDKLPLFPSFDDPAVWVPLLLIPLAVQWWSSWYPGAEPGGGGYVAQRMLAAKNERHAVGATLLFNIAHYALRPWPWIIIALCSIIVFPDLDALRTAFPNLDPDIIDDDLAFSAMLSTLPRGLLGLVIAALIAAFMSTISTHLNWGASYVVNDFYARFVEPDASERKLVNLGRLTTVALMILAGMLALLLSNALQAFGILLQIGAGTGLIFILRWFWWRVNAYTEIVAMFVSFAIAIYFEAWYDGDLATHWRLVVGVGVTTAVWMAATFLTRPTDTQVLKSFLRRIRPYGAGWRPILRQPDMHDVRTDGRLGVELTSMVCGCLLVYGLLFATGYIIYGQWTTGLLMLGIAATAGILLYRNWGRLRFE